MCWEIAKLLELRRLTLPVNVSTWLERATRPSVAQLVPLTLPIIVDSTSLPPGFHKDPADQLIVATARTLGAVLLTVDEKILSYSHVRCRPLLHGRLLPVEPQPIRVALSPG